MNQLVAIGRTAFETKEFCRSSKLEVRPVCCSEALQGRLGQLIFIILDDDESINCPATWPISAEDVYCLRVNNAVVFTYYDKIGGVWRYHSQ